MIYDSVFGFRHDVFNVGDVSVWFGLMGGLLHGGIIIITLRAIVMLAVCHRHMFAVIVRVGTTVLVTHHMGVSRWFGRNYRLLVYSVYCTNVGDK